MASKARKGIHGLASHTNEAAGRKSVLSEQEKPTALAADKIFEQASSEGYDLGQGGFEVPQSELPVPQSASIINAADSETGVQLNNTSAPMIYQSHEHDYVPPKSQTNGKVARPIIVRDSGSRAEAVKQAASSSSMTAEEVVKGKPRPRDDVLSDYTAPLAGPQAVQKPAPSAPAVVVDHGINHERADSVESSDEEQEQRDELEEQRPDANRDKSAAEMQRERNRALLLQFMKQRDSK